MKKKTIFLNLLIFYILFFLKIDVMADTVSASADRTKVSLNETITLTLRVEGNIQSIPNLSPLYSNFDILRKQENQHFSVINGKKNSWLDWVLVLSPKESGSLVIPSIKIGELYTNPIKIHVVEDYQTSFNEGKEVFIQASTDYDSVYIQQQVLLTLKIFYRVNLSNDSELSPLSLNKALVKKLGDQRNYESIVDGLRYHVLELKFAIFPQESGELIIDPFVFKSNIFENSGNSHSFFSIQRSVPIVVRSPIIKINVKDKVKDYIGDSWLPTTNFSVKEHWSSSLDNIHLGDTVTRKIDIEGHNLLSAQLPDIPDSKINKIKTYSDRPDIQDHINDAGVIGRKTISVAFMPIKLGVFKVPQLKFYWFDIKNNQIRTEILPEQIITVNKNLEMDEERDKDKISSDPKKIEPIITDNQDQDQDQDQHMQNKKDDSKVNAPVEINNTFFNYYFYFFLILILITILSLAILWHKKRQNIKVTIKKKKTLVFNELIIACRLEDVSNVKAKFMIWTQLYFEKPELNTLKQCIEVWASNQLKDLFKNVDISMYAKDKGYTFSYDDLIACFKFLKKNTVKNENIKPDLPTLYPR